MLEVNMCFSGIETWYCWMRFLDFFLDRVGLVPGRVWSMAELDLPGKIIPGR
jgi:hypothetical protein